MLFWTTYRADAYDHLGYLPGFLSLADPSCASIQLHKNYRHGGGWLPFGRGQWRLERESLRLKYPGDPPLEPVASTELRDELIVVYPHGMVMILQLASGAFEVARMD